MRESSLYRGLKRTWLTRNILANKYNNNTLALISNGSSISIRTSHIAAAISFLFLNSIQSLITFCGADVYNCVCVVRPEGSERSACGVRLCVVSTCTYGTIYKRCILAFFFYNLHISSALMGVICHQLLHRYDHHNSIRIRRVALHRIRLNERKVIA